TLENTGDDLLINRWPHRWQGSFQEASVPCRGHPRIKDRYNALVPNRTDQAPSTLGQADRRVRRGNLHEPIATVFGYVLRTGLGDGIIGARERDLVDDHQAARITGHVHALPQGHGSKEAGVPFAAELLDQ